MSGQIAPAPPHTISTQPGLTEQYVKLPNGECIPMSVYQEQYGQTILSQPVAQPGLMYVPPAPSMVGVPPGLEYLTLIDTVFVKQIIELIEVITDFETRNKYSLRNANGDQVYYAAEESGCCSRQCCGPNRGFTMHITDNFKREVIRVRRPFKCFGGCCGTLACFRSMAHECTIESPPGNVIGTVIQTWGCCSTKFIIRDENDRDLFKIDGPCCCLLLGCQDKEFPVLTMDGLAIGSITKKWGGCCREAFTDADVFSVNFPLDLDVKLKAVLLGATFLVDFVEFEKVMNQTHVQQTS
ncbi:unnamed protein product [Auanema sp. JU1783]|nr:unnamed protein product [Auanema sp. JU1783]